MAENELQQYVLEITSRLERLEKMSKELLSKTNQLCQQQQQEQQARLKRARDQELEQSIRKKIKIEDMMEREKARTEQWKGYMH